MHRPAVQALLLAVGSCLLFSGSLTADFVYDDFPVVVDNARVQEGRVLDGPWLRSVRHTTLVLDRRLFGEDPRGYHAQNLFWHVLCVLGVWALARRLFEGALAPLVAAGLFAVHPIHVEAVTGIANRKELLSLAFGLGASLAWLRGQDETDARRRLPWLGLAAAALALALASKFVAIALPLCWLAYEFWFVAPERRWLLRSPWLWIGAAAAGVALFAWLQGAHPLDPESLAHSRTLKGYLGEVSVGAVQFSSARAFWTYVGLLVWPSGLCPDHLMELSTRLFEWPTAGAWLGLLATIAALPLLGARLPVVGFGVFWLLATFVPVSNLYPSAYLLADRYMYAPSVGFALGVVGLGAALHARGALRAPGVASLAAWALCLLMGGGYALVTWNYNAVWANEVSLWAYTRSCEPRSYKAENTLGIRMAERGDVAAALVHYAAAIEKGSPNAPFNRGALLLSLGRPAQALADLELAAEYLPERADVHFERGNALTALERFGEAETHYSRSLALAPDHSEAYNNRGAARARLGRFDEARSDYLTALSHDPGHAAAHFNLAGALVALGDATAARRALEEAAELGLEQARAALQQLDGERVR